MSDNEMVSASHAVYALRLHIVFVTKYRRKTLTPALLDALREAFAEILAHWRCTLIEFGGEADHVHLLVGIHPALNIATLINNLKSASSRRMRNRFADHLRQFYGKPYFWHRAYYVGSVGSTSLETIKRYVASQGTQEKPRKAAKRPPPVTEGNPRGT
jgi:putative transposase